MLTLGSIPGQDRAVELLRSALERDRVHHAYLFSGPAGSGKRATALAVSAALLCEKRPAEGCGDCDTCERIAAGNHPDVISLERQGAAQIIPIESIRTQVVPALALPPHEGRARVFIIDEAGALPGPAANALLKSLEEPPARTHFILCTQAADKLLPTIRSRCQRIVFQSLGADVRAQLAGDDEEARRISEQTDAVLAACDSTLEAIFDAAAEGARERTEVAKTLALCANRLHELAAAAARDGHGARARALARRAQIALDTEVAVTQHNAHGQLALEHMMISMRAVALPAEGA